MSEDVILKDGNHQKLGLYAVYDKKGEAYDVPFFARSDLLAKRRFIVDVRNPQSLLSQFRDDFVLVRIGIWHQDTGVIDAFCETLVEGKEVQE